MIKYKILEGCFTEVHGGQIIEDSYDSDVTQPDDVIRKFANIVGRKYIEPLSIVLEDILPSDVDEIRELIDLMGDETVDIIIEDYRGNFINIRPYKNHRITELSTCGLGRFTLAIIFT